MNDRITLSVIMLRKHSELFSVQGGTPAQKFLANMLYQSSRRTLTAKEAEKAIAGIKELRSRQ